MPALSDLIGVVVAGRYRLTESIGTGGMGAVFAASDTRLDGQRVAVKLLVREIAGGDTASRFRREAKILARINHPNVVSILDAGELDDGRPFIVMELLDGESLADRRKRQPLSPGEVIEVIDQVARGLAAAHEHGVIHRDLKPHNLFLCKTPGEPGVGAVKILDFGISKMLGAVTVQTDSATLVGTPQYMAPEQARGEHDRVGARSDVFSLGVIAYELLSGRRPFDGEALHEVIFKIIDDEPPPLSELRPELPARISAAISIAMAKEPEDRFADAIGFARALGGQDPVPVAALVPRRPSKPQTVVQRPRRRPGDAVAEAPTQIDEPPATRPSPRSRWPLIAVATSAVGAVVIAAVVLAGSSGPPAAADGGAATRSLEAARAAAVRARRALAAGELEGATDGFVAAYRGGDRTLATRIALRHLIERRRSLLATVESDTDISDGVIAGGQLWVASGSWLRRYTLDGELVDTVDPTAYYRIAPSRDDRYIAAWRSGELVIIDRATGDVVSREPGNDGGWVADDEYIVGTVEVADPYARQLYRRRRVGDRRAIWSHLCGLGPPLFAAAYDAGRLLLCSVETKLIDAETGEVVSSLPSVTEVFTGRTAGMRSANRVLGIDARARYAAVFSTNNRGYVASLATKKIKRVSRVGSARINWVRFDSAAARMLLEVEGNPLEIYALGGGDTLQLERVVSGLHGVVAATGLSTRGLLAVGDSGGWIQVQEAASGQSIFSTRAHDSAIDGISIDDARHLLSTAGRELKLWRLGDPVLARVNGIDEGGFLELSADGRAVIISPHDGGDALWWIDGVEAEVEPRIRQPLEMSGDASLVLAADGFYDRSGVRLAPLDRPHLEAEVASSGDVAIVEHLDRTEIFVRSGDRLIVSREIATEGRDRAAMSPDGRLIAVGGPRLGRLDFEETETGKTVASFDAAIAPLAFIDDERLLGNDDNTQVLVAWRDHRSVPMGASAEVAGAGGRLVARLVDRFALVDPKTGEMTGQIPDCAPGRFDVGGGLGGFVCDERGDVLIWDFEAGAAAVVVGRAELGDRAVAVAVDRRDRFALIATRRAVFRVDLTPEDRPVAEVEALTTR